MMWSDRGSLAKIRNGGSDGVISWDSVWGAGDETWLGGAAKLSDKDLTNG